MKKRNIGIDAIKGYGMLLVIAGHMNYALIGNTFFTLIYSFHMPLFFFLSGYLFTSKLHIPYIDFVKKRAKALLLPYVLFFIISALYGYFIRPLLSKTEFPHMNMVDMMEALFLSGGKLTDVLLYNFPLWFLPLLFISEILFYWFVKINRKDVIIGLLIVIILVTEFYQMQVIGRPPFHINVLPISVIFMIIGWLAKNIMPKIRFNKLITLFLTLFAIYLSSQNMGAHVAKVNNVYLYIFVAILFIVITFSMMNHVEKENFFTYIGRNNLTILGIHALIINAYYLTNIGELFTNYNGMVRFFADFLLVLLIIMVIIEGIGKIKKMRSKKNEKIHKTDET